MPKKTEEQKEKTKGIAEKVGDTLWNSTAIMLVIILVTILLCSIAFFGLLFYHGGANAEEQRAALLEDEQARAYYPSEGETCGDCEYGVDLADLGVEPLAYEAFYRCEDEPPFIMCDYLFSTKDDLENPTKEYTLSYVVWKTTESEELDEIEANFKKRWKTRYGDEGVAAKLDYGATEAYWLGDELYLRYGDNCLIRFNSVTTRELIESQVCADFMRTEMKL